jgi:S-adenosylmethionine hydrolase
MESKMNRRIALLTDFGLKDHYVGSLKAVIYSINPNAQVFDLTHDIHPQNVKEGAFILDVVYPFLAKGTIVLAVIDPGVGSARQAISIKTSRGFLVGPNNGIFTMVLKREKKYEARAVTNNRYFMEPVSATFHGRDIFAPVAAHLSKKDIFASLGPRIPKIHQLDLAQVKISRGAICGELIHIDRFGNTMTNISKSQTCGTGKKFVVEVKKKKVLIKPFFSAGRKGELIAVWNSSDLLELAVRESSAEKLYGLKIGDSVLVHTK